MAQNQSFIKIVGTLDGLTFYNSRGQNFIKKKSGVTADRMKHDPAFKRTRENYEEFAGCATSGKSFRMAFAAIVTLMRDSSLMNRVTSLMKKIQDKGVGNRGQREINIEGYGEMLENLEFNATVPFDSIFYVASELPVIAPARNAVTWAVQDFNTENYVNAPEGATHFALVLAAGFMSNFEFEQSTQGYVPTDPKLTGKGQVVYSREIPLDGMVGSATVLEVDMTNVTTVPVTTMLMAAVGIVFYQEVNAKLYMLAQNNAMKVAIVG